LPQIQVSDNCETIEGYVGKDASFLNFVLRDQWSYFDPR
jgi:hypothetical protein